MEQLLTKYSKNAQRVILTFLPIKYQLSLIYRVNHFLESFILNFQNNQLERFTKLSLFANYMSIYTHLFKQDCNSKFINCFLSQTLQILDINDTIPQSERYVIKLYALSYFINKFIDKKKYHKFKLIFKKESDISFMIDLLEMIPNSKDFTYIIEGDQNLPYEKYPKLFTYVKRFKPITFFVFTQDILIKKCIQKQSKFEMENILVHGGNIDDFIEYSKINHNVFKRINSPQSELVQIEPQKITQLIECNKESIIEVPRVPINGLLCIINLEVIDFPELEENEIESNMKVILQLNLSKIRKMYNVPINILSRLIPYINNMTQIKVITLSKALYLINFKENIQSLYSNVIRKFCCTMTSYSTMNDVNEYITILEKCPHLERITKNESEGEPKGNLYDIELCKQIYHLSYEQIFMLLHNYISRKESNYISLMFRSQNIQELNDFFSFGNTHYKNVLSKIELIIFAGDKSNEVPIPYIKYLNVGNLAGLNINVEHIECINFTKVSFDNQKVLNYLEKTQPFLIKIDKKNFNINQIPFDKLHKTEIILRDNEIAGIKHCNQWKLFD